MNAVIRNLSMRAVGCIVFVLSATYPVAAASIVWNGPTISFTRASNVDFTLPQNQDHLTPTIAFTRGNTQGLFNIAQEASFTDISPKDTEWATDLNNPAQMISAANFAALSFANWTTAYSNNPGANTVGRNAVVHLISNDIYLDLKFTAFQGGGSGGGFAYLRSTPVPEPATPILMLSLLAALTKMRGFRRVTLGPCDS